MRIAFGWSSIFLRTWESKEDLIRFAKQFGESLFIGESAEQEIEFYSVAVCGDFRHNNKRRFLVAIISEGQGVTPQVLALATSGLCLFGLNSEAVCVNLDTRQVAYRVNLGYLFRTMVPLPEVGLILILHETGAKAIREDGQEVWSFSKDVLEDARLEGSKIHFEFMDSEPLTLEIISGKELI